MVPSNDERVKEIFACLALFCLAVWYFTAEFLGIYSFLLSFAIYVFGFFLIVFYNRWLEDRSHFRATRCTRRNILFSFYIFKIPVKFLSRTIASLISRRTAAAAMLRSRRMAPADESTSGLNQAPPPPISSSWRRACLPTRRLSWWGKR